MPRILTCFAEIQIAFGNIAERTILDPTSLRIVRDLACRIECTDAAGSADQKYRQYRNRAETLRLDGYMIACLPLAEAVSLVAALE